MMTYARAGKKTPLFTIALLVLFTGCSKPSRTPLQEVDGLGTNPGALRMFKYVPDSLEPASSVASEGHSGGETALPRVASPPGTGVPLVVALHGCLQDAARYGLDSGWVHLADRWGFLLLLPEQQLGNNPTRCFSWFSPGDYGRDRGEALSIRQMVDRMSRDHAVDARRIYVTGISAGAAMALALAAVYPEVFAGAAPIAGIPFGCADGLLSGLGCMWDPPDKEAADWGAAVRSATSYKGPWPRISVWQGDADTAVDPANATAVVRQWTAVHGIENAPERSDDLEGHVHSLFQDSNGKTLVESYRIKGMAHGVPVDPGPRANQCGTVGKFFLDVGICSGIYIARFWGLNQEIPRQAGEPGARGPLSTPK